MYCKAKGMPVDHIGANATLQPNKDCEYIHSAVFKCSHPWRKEDGVKFLYCKPCGGKALSFANFFMRHSHPESDLRLLYCKAKGIHDDHIGANATLQFQKDCEYVHGAVLQCSHTLCKKDGYKFSYCKHCKKGFSNDNSFAP